MVSKLTGGCKHQRRPNEKLLISCLAFTSSLICRQRGGRRPAFMFWKTLSFFFSQMQSGCGNDLAFSNANGHANMVLFKKKKMKMHLQLEKRNFFWESCETSA